MRWCEARRGEAMRWCDADRDPVDEQLLVRWGRRGDAVGQAKRRFPFHDARPCVAMVGEAASRDAINGGSGGVRRETTCVLGRHLLLHPWWCSEGDQVQSCVAVREHLPQRCQHVRRGCQRPSWGRPSQLRWDGVELGRGQVIEPILMAVPAERWEGSPLFLAASCVPVWLADAPLEASLLLAPVLVD